MGFSSKTLYKVQILFYILMFKEVYIHKYINPDLFFKSNLAKSTVRQFAEALVNNNHGTKKWLKSKVS